MMASSVTGSSLKPSCAEKRRARRIRSASSLNRSVGFPTQRMTLRCKSLIPSNRSTSPSSLLYAIALIVKSRRRRSSARLEVKTTSFGWRPSSYSPSMRYVVTSCAPLPARTVTVPCSSPVSTVRSKISFTCCGEAEVVISQSSGSRARIVSRTQPPTAYASKPFACRESITIFTLGGIFIFKFVISFF